LPDYDSGWFAVNSQPAPSEIVLNTGFALPPSRFMLQQCGQLSANGSCSTRIVIAGTTGYHDGGANINPLTITFDTPNIYIGMTNQLWAFNYWTPAQGWNCKTANCFTAFYRVIAWH
jgi:hypothetical protein